MRRCPALLGLATSLAALLAVAIGPAAASAGTPPAPTPAAAQQHRRECTDYTGVPDSRSNIQARVCIELLDAPDRIFTVVVVHNRAGRPRAVGVDVRLGYGDNHTYHLKRCGWRVSPREFEYCSAYVTYSGRPIWTKANVVTSRGDRDIWSPEIDH